MGEVYIGHATLTSLAGVNELLKVDMGVHVAAAAAAAIGVVVIIVVETDLSNFNKTTSILYIKW